MDSGLWFRGLGKPRFVSSATKDWEAELRFGDRTESDSFAKRLCGSCGKAEFATPSVNPGLVRDPAFLDSCVARKGLLPMGAIATRGSRALAMSVPPF